MTTDASTPERIDRLERKPGTCIPWTEQAKVMPPILANEELVQKVWEDNDALAYTFIWQMLVSF
jgi:hypothetical protein